LAQALPASIAKKEAVTFWVTASFFFGSNQSTFASNLVKVVLIALANLI
jgi:hypothetical protein